MSIGNLNLSNLLYGNQSVNTNTTNSSYGNILSPNSNGIDTSIFAKAIDINKDGKISSEEFQAFLSNPSGILQNANSVNTNQESSNSILQLILSLLTKSLSNQQTEQNSSAKNTPQAQAYAPVRNNSNVNNATASANKHISTAAAATPSVKTVKTDETKVDAKTQTIENSSLADKTGASKMINAALANDTSSGKEVIEDKNDTYKIGSFYDEKGVLTKKVYYDKKNNDAVYLINFCEDGKVVKSLISRDGMNGQTGEWLHAGGAESPSGFNLYDADGKLTKSTIYDHNDKGELIHHLSSKYENEKLKETQEITNTKNQAIRQTLIKKSYDEEGNVTHTKLRTINREGTMVITHSDKDGTVISKSTRVKDGATNGYSETTVDKEGHFLSKTTEEQNDGKFILKDYDKDGNVIFEFIADKKAVFAGDVNKTTYTDNADDGSKTVLEIDDDGKRTTTNYDKAGKAISVSGESKAKTTSEKEPAKAEESFDL